MIVSFASGSVSLGRRVEFEYVSDFIYVYKCMNCMCNSMCRGIMAEFVCMYMDICCSDVCTCVCIYI